MSRGGLPTQPPLCQLSVFWICVVLVVVVSIVPSTITGIVIAAIDYLLDDHVPNSIQSYAAFAAATTKTFLLEAPSAATTGSTVASLLAYFGHSMLNTTANPALLGEMDAAQLAGVLNRASALADAQAGMASRWYEHFAGLGYDTQVAVSSWKRVSQTTVNVTLLLRLNNATQRGNSSYPFEPWTASTWDSTTVFDSFYYPYSSDGVSLVLNNSGSSSSSNNATMLVAADALLAFHNAMQLSLNGAVRWWFPLSEPAVSLADMVLVDGLYLDVAIRGAPFVVRNSSSLAQYEENVTSAGSPSLVTDPTFWRSVMAQLATLEVQQLVTKALPSMLALRPSAVAFLHPQSMTLMGCTDGTGASVLDIPLVLSRGVVVAATSPLQQPNIAYMPTVCASVAQILLDHAGQLATSSGSAAPPFSIASSSLRVAVVPLGGDSATPAGRAALNFSLAVATLPGATETSVTNARGQIAVVAFVVAFLTACMLVVTVRLLTQPLAAITRAIYACAQLQLQHIEIMETSVIVEIADIQRALYYLAVRLHHYLKYIPEKDVVKRLADLPSSSSSSSSEGSEDDSGSSDGGNDSNGSGSDAVLENHELDGTRRAGVFTGRHSMAAEQLTTAQRALLLKHPEAMNHDDSLADDKIELRGRRKMKRIRAPQHSIIVEVLYESRHLNRNTLNRKNMINKYCTFVFKHRVTDPVLAMLRKECREHLHERPGEELVLFAADSVGGSSLRQLYTDEDVLYCIENIRASSGNGAAATARGPMGGVIGLAGTRAVLRVSARKSSDKTVLPILIALGTLATVVTRLVLSIARLGDPSTTTQVLGLLLLGCLSVQVVQNCLISLYLIRRFRVLDRDFDAWAAVSKADVVFCVTFGALNVTNLEMMGCHIRLTRWLRLSAPISSRLRVKISKYSLVGFIVGDLLPFVFILINIILQQQYRDPLVLLSLAFSVLSVASILVSHGILRFVVTEAVAANASLMSGGGGGGGGGFDPSSGGRSSGSPHIANRSSLLSKRDVSVVHVSISGENELLDGLTIPLADTLLEKYYQALQSHANRTGGMLLEARGLQVVIAYNAHVVVPAHTRVAYLCFCKLRDEVERSVLPSFFGSEAFRSHASTRFLPKALQRNPLAVNRAVRDIHTRHRLIASLVTAEMSMGYVGTLTAQTFQRVGTHAALCEMLCKANEHYGSTLLTTAETERELGSCHHVARRIDEIALSCEMVVPMSSYENSLPESGRSGGASAATTLLRPARPDGGTPCVTVVELVLNDFNPTVLSSATDAGPLHKNGGPASPAAENTASHGTPQQLRRRPRTQRTVDAVRAFSDALEILYSLENAAPLARYVELHPSDVVARNVFRWTRFLFAANRERALRIPRSLTSLGISRHPCEVLEAEGNAMEPAAQPEGPNAELLAMQQAHESKFMRLRPPRSERRAKASSGIGNAQSGGTILAVGASIVGGTSSGVIEQMLAADERGGYTVRFGPTL